MARMTPANHRQMHACIYLGHGAQVSNFSCVVSHDWKYIQIYDLYNHLCEKPSIRASLFFDCSQQHWKEGVEEDEPAIVPEPSFCPVFLHYELPAQCHHNVVKLSISCSPNERACGNPPQDRPSKYAQILFRGLDTAEHWGELFHMVEGAATLGQSPHVKGNCGPTKMMLRRAASAEDSDEGSVEDITHA